MHRIDIYLEASSWYLGKRERWGGYVLATHLKNGQLWTKEGFIWCRGTYNAALLESLNVAMERVVVKSEIHIHSANSFILDMIDNNLDTWAAKGFVNAKGEPIKEKRLWERFWRNRQEHLIVTERGLHEFSHWMKGEMAGMQVDNVNKPHKYNIGKDVEKDAAKTAEKEKEKET